MNLKIFYFLILAVCVAEAALVTGRDGAALVDANGNLLVSRGDFINAVQRPGFWTKSKALEFANLPTPAQKVEFAQRHSGEAGIHTGVLGLGRAQSELPRSRAPHHHPPAAAAAPADEERDLELALALSRADMHQGAAASASPPSPSTLDDDHALALAMERSLQDAPPPSQRPAARAPLPLNPLQEWKRLPFSVVEGGDRGMVDIGYPAHGRTEQYKYFKFPKAPMIHPYNPSIDEQIEADNPMWREGRRAPYVSVNLKAPIALLRDRLPDYIKKWTHYIPSDKLNIFWIVQDNPWTASARILFRPHYWLDPDAPYIAQNYSNSFEGVHAGILSSIPEEIPFHEAAMKASIHGPGHIVSSPENGLIAGATRPHQTFSFWSLAEVNGRAAITLHWILNDNDNALMIEAIQHSHTLEELLEVFNRISQHRGSPILRSHILPELDHFLDFHPRH